MKTQAAEIIARGDPAEILRMALGARFAADEGRFCECEHPVLLAYDLMCGECLLENQGQIEKRMRRSSDPHTFEPRPDLEIMCNVCTMWEDDPRHHGDPL